MNLAVVLLLCGCCALFSHNSEAQDLSWPAETPPPSSNCTCELGHGKCAENGGCRCDPGWDGPRCDECVRMPGCVHGSCHQPWQCSCEDGWMGRFCDKDVLVCTRDQPCLNGASCVLSDSGDFSCLCLDGFHGRHCQLKTGPCQKTKSPCKNGGLCEDRGGFAPELSCRCLAGFTGPRCETNMDDCLMRPCANGATCLDGVNRFSCLCPVGFTGRFCTINLDDCASRPCLNAGRCIDRVSSFTCLCPPAYTGRTCEIRVQESGSDTHRKPISGNGSHMTTASGHGMPLFNVTLVPPRGAEALSQLELLVLLVLGGLTLAVVALTAALVLCGQCQERSRCECRPAPARPHPFHRCRTPRQQSLPRQQECKISFLPAPAPAELEKKRLNNDVM